MLSLLSIITLIPLAVSAARIPHHVLDLDASLVSDTKSALDLGLVPRSPNPAPGIFDVVNNVPIVSNVVNTVTQILPDIEAGVSFCVTLGADANLELGSQSVFLAAGICICIDADVEVSNGNAISINTSAGQTIRGALAVKLKKSIINCMSSSPKSGPQYFNLVLGSNVCLQLDLFIGFTQHDFTNGQGPNRCCARSCIAPYVPGPGKSCVCPPANLCGGQCFSGPTITCSGTCYLASDYTCPSNNPNPVPRDKIEKAVPRRRSEIPFGRCSFGQELCPVATSAGYECVNTISDMESCGGCVHSFRGTGKQGQDCTAIPNVNEVMCNQGQCQVVSCEAGYRAANNATICVSESRLDNALKQSTSLLIQGLTH